MDRMYKAAQLAIYSSFILGAFFYAIGLLFPEFLVSIFSQEDQELLTITVEGIRIYFAAFLFMGVNITITSYLQSKEYGRASISMCLSRAAIFIFVFLMILPKFYGLMGVWLTMPLAEHMTFIAFFLFYSSVRKVVMHSLKPNAKVE